jgi:hypothetical protein
MKVKAMDWDGKGTKAWRFLCPGCGEHHAPIEGQWGFNGDMERPTFTPSILVRSGHYAKNDGGECWCTFKERFGREPGFKCKVCHSFVTDGKIQFLNDCTHALAGQMVDLPDLED